MSKWISIKNKISNEPVLALNYKQDSNDYRKMLVGCIAPNSESLTGFACESDSDILYEVTHWQLLPRIDGIDEE